MPNKIQQQSLDSETFLRIRKRYLLAIAGIALTIIAAQVLIQRHLDSQLNDSRVINVAGRQRAYSQKLVKEALLLREVVGQERKRIIVSEIEKTLAIWKASHVALQAGNEELGFPVEKDPDILAEYRQIDRHHTAMVSAIEELLDFDTDPAGSTAKDFEENIGILLENERPFLRLMDVIVNQYDERSKAQLQNLKQKEYLLLAFSLLILILEILFIFRPLSVQIRNTIGDLMQNQSKSDARNEQIQQLYLEKEKSLQELQELNFVIDNAALFASARKDGSIVFISKKLLNLLGLGEPQVNRPLAELLTTDTGQQEYLREILKGNRKNVIRTEEIKIITIGGKEVWLD
ncbi:MAG: type IV pili methyl-accepting chemotaxis transducer N-terminal domain-containing protein, partial [Pricia sp.]